MTETLEALLDVKMQGEGKYATSVWGQLAAHVSTIVDPFTGDPIARVTTEGVCHWSVKSVSQGDELNARWFNIIEMG